MPATQGVPGALSNQPTPAGTAPETTPAPGSAPDAKTVAAAAPGSSAKNATRNFELDKTITHTRLATGVLHRLSVAVVVDDRHTLQADGKIQTQAYTPEDINRFSDLVKQAVGFDSARGDQVTVTNVAFKIPEELEALPEAPVWEQGWFLDLMKQAAAVLAVLFLLFGVLRPTMRSLAGREKEEKKAAALAEEQADDEQARIAATGGVVSYNYNPEGVPVAAPALQQTTAAELPEHMDDLLLIDVPHGYGKRLEYLQKVVDNDPRLVAQVVKRWVR